MAKLFRKFLTCVASISVEPAIIVAAIAINIYGMSADLGMYRVMCDKLFNAKNGTDIDDHQYFECWDLSHPLGTDLPNGTTWWEQAEIQIQQRTTTWSMTIAVITLPPSMLMNLILGAYSDRRGRKGVLLLGIFGMIIFQIPTAIIFSSPETVPVFICYVGGFVASAVTGGFSTTMAASTSYLSDTVTDKEMLTVRMTLLQMCLTLGTVIGPLIANELIDTLGYEFSICVAMGVMSAAFASALFIVKSIPPRKVAYADQPTEDKLKLEMVNFEKTGSGAEPCCLREIWIVMKEVPRLLMESWRTMTKRREGHQRAYIFAAAYVMCAFSCVDTTFNSTVFTLFVQKEPLSWSQDQVSYFRSMANLIRLLGTFFGVFIFKKFLHMSDILIVILAFASMIGQATLITLSTETWMMYAAASVGVFGSLSFPCAQAFVAKILDPDEVGKVFGAFSLAMGVSFFFSSVGAGAIYQATVAFMPTMVFLICGVIVLSALCLTLWLYFDYNRHMKRVWVCCGSEDVYQVQ